MIIVTWVNRLPRSCCVFVWCVHVCQYIYAHSIVCCFAWGSSVKSWHSHMIWQPCHKLICLSNFNYSSNSNSPSGYKLISVCKDTHIPQAYISMPLVPSTRRWAYSPHESLFRLYLVIQREINAVWAGGMINCSQSSPSMAQPLNNRVNRWSWQ